MTNREYLSTLSNYDLSNYIYTFLIPVIGKLTNNSVVGVAEWLGQERSVSDYPYWTDGFHCSRCGYKEQSSGFQGTCPNCGAKIKGVDDGVLY